MYSLEGIDGNAFSIISYVRMAMSETGFTKSEIEGYTKDAMSADYSHLVKVSQDYIEQCNQ